MELTTARPLWLALFCVALGVAVAWWLYRGSSARHGWSTALARTMAVFRTTVIAFLAFFLLDPLVKAYVQDVRKPVVVIAHDGSSSLLSGTDTNDLRTGYAERVAALSERLSKRFEVRPFTYGSGISEGSDFGQTEQLTDIDALFRTVYDRFSGPDLGAVIIDGDGIWNRGSDPRPSATRPAVPVYAIAMGDTTVRPDLVLKAVEHNRLSYLGNEFPLLVRVEARHLAGSTSRVSVMHEGVELLAKELPIAADPLFVELPLLVKATRTGLQRYTVTVRPVDGETSLANNSRTVLVEVLDDRKKILLLAAAPHPDLGAIRRALTAMEGYATELHMADAFAGDLAEYDMVVMHQLPNARSVGKVVVDKVLARGMPAWYIVGTATDHGALADHKAGAAIQAQRGRTSDVQAQVDPSFSWFTLTPEAASAIERFPPLQVPFGETSVAKGAAMLLTQRVGVVETRLPLLVAQQGERRTALLCGEGLWRWRLADQQAQGNTAAFDELVRKTVQFLSVGADKQRFRTDHPPVFAENEPVTINAELYDRSYEPVNTPEARVTIVDEAGKEFPFLFSRAGSAYRLSTGPLPPGRYTYTARTTLGEEALSASGGFTVEELVAERLTTVADHGLWRDIAARTGGAVTTPDAAGLDSIATALEQRTDLAARSYGYTSFRDLISVKWLFFVLLVLLAAEWAARRWSGSY